MFSQISNQSLMGLVPVKAYTEFSNNASPTLTSYFEYIFKRARYLEADLPSKDRLSINMSELFSNFRSDEISISVSGKGGKTFIETEETMPLFNDGLQQCIYWCNANLKDKVWTICLIKHPDVLHISIWVKK